MRVVLPPSTGLHRRLLGGCLGLALLAVLGFGLLIAATFHYASSRLEHTAAPPGDPRRFDPVARHGEVAAFAGSGVRLSALDARFVRSDGTLDLEAEYQPSPNVRYDFVREVAAPANAPPLGAGSSPDGRWYEAVEVEVSRPWEFRSVRRVGAGGSASYQYFNRGMRRQADPPSGRAPGEPVPPPACAFKGLWAQAIARGAPATAVARIRYDARGYEFDIDGTRLGMRFDRDCNPVPR